MKKYILALAAVLGMTLSMTAQTDDPNRLLVIDQNGQTKGFNLGNVNRVEFTTIEGEVAADIKIISSSLTELNVTVTRTPECQSFLFNVIPGVLAKQLESNPASASAYLERGGQIYYEDFSEGKVTGIELEYNTEYAVATVGYDRYDVACDFRAAYFTTEKAPILGNPQVDVTLVEAGLTTLDLHFAPNADTKEYYFCIFGEGQAQEQFDMFGPMFGFTNMGQMIMQFSGSAYTEAMDYQYTGMDPNTKYELYVQPVDKNGNMAELQVFPLETKKQGGSGAAYVEIEMGDYTLRDWYGEMLPSQFITYIPNDQTWSYRFSVYKASDYDTDPEGYNAAVASEPPMPNMANWFFYSTLSTDYQIDPSTEIVVVAAAKNADGIWGEPNVVRYTTPAAISETPVTAKVLSNNAPTKISTRIVPRAINRPGFAVIPNQIRLTK